MVVDWIRNISAREEQEIFKLFFEFDPQVIDQMDSLRWRIIGSLNKQH